MDTRDTFTLNIDLNNDAFFGQRLEEIARILRVAADLVENGGHTMGTTDINGNLVARWQIG